MVDFIVFQLLQDNTIPDKIKNKLRKAFNIHDLKTTNKIVDDILLVKTTNVLLKIKSNEV